MTTIDVPTRHGLMRTIVGDVGVSKALQVLGEYSSTELDTIKVAIGLMRAGGKKTISLVEAGAFIGDMTVPLSRMVDRLYAFEPQSEVREILEHNLKVNGCENVTVFPFALGHEEGRAGLREVDPNSPGSNQMDLGAEEGGMEIRTLDSLGLECDFLKADVEGMEVLLLAGAQGTIFKQRPVLFLERDTVDAPGGITQEAALETMGYSCYPMVFMMYNSDNWNGAENPFGGMASFMNLGIPKA